MSAGVLCEYTVACESLSPLGNSRQSDVPQDKCLCHSRVWMCRLGRLQTVKKQQDVCWQSDCIFGQKTGLHHNVCLGLLKLCGAGTDTEA